MNAYVKGFLLTFLAVFAGVAAFAAVSGKFKKAKAADQPTPVKPAV